MATTDSIANEAQLRDDLVRCIKRFSLSYEQHQLIHASQYALLVPHIMRRRRVLGIVLTVCAVGLFNQSVQAIQSSANSVPWIIGAVLTGAWLLLHYFKTCDLATAYRAYTTVAGFAETSPSTLASELKLAFDLDYDEHRALKSGNATAAAHGIVARRISNSRTFGIWAAALSLISIAIWGWVGAGIAALLCIGFLASLLRDLFIIARVEHLLDRFPDQKPVGPAKPRK